MNITVTLQVIIMMIYSLVWASQAALVVKNPPATAGDMRLGFDPWVEKIPWRTAKASPLVLLPGEPYGQRSPAD